MIQLLKKKSTKKNYQDILIQYLNKLNNSNSKIDVMAKKMKISFFNCISDLVLNKNDELKYLILYFEEKRKKNLVEKYYNVWKNIAISAKCENLIKKYEIENNNKIIYRTNKFYNLNDKKQMSLIEIKKYIIDYDEEINSKEKNNISEKNIIIEEEKQNIEKNIKYNIKSDNFINNRDITNKVIDDKHSLNQITKRSKTDEDYEKVLKYRENFEEMEEEYRIKYLLSSKSYINDNDADNIINIKKSINKAIKNTRNYINKIDEYETNKKSKEILDSNEKNNINTIICNSLEKLNHNINSTNTNENFSNKKYFINNDLKIEKINTKVINNFNIKLESLSQKGNINSKDKLYSITSVNEFSFAPISSSHNKDKNIINNKKNLNKNKKLEKIISIKDLNESEKSDNNIYDKYQQLLNNNIFDERLINEEMIQKFLENKKNESIFHYYKSKNLYPNKTINSYNYKEKYLGITLGGTKRKKQSKSNNNILKSENSLDININKSDEEIINKSNNTTLKKDNSNFITINKINNMLEEMFDEEKNKKLKGSISQTDNINNHKINLKKDLVKKNNNIIINNDNNNKIKSIKSYYISNNNNFTHFNKQSCLNVEKNNKIKKDELTKNKNNKFQVNIKGNDKKYLLNINSNYFTGNNTTKNSSNLISKKSSFKSNLSTMSFNQRQEFFKNKKGLDMQKIKSTLTNIENNIYTFVPQTNKARNNLSKGKRSKSSTKMINYNISKEETKNKINYEYLNELYLDYKKRNFRLKKLREENDKEDGISFVPNIYKNNKWDKVDKH